MILLTDLVTHRVDLHDDLLMLPARLLAFGGESRALLTRRTDICSYALKLVHKVNDFGIFGLLGD